MKKLSVIIVNYNVKQYLYQCLRSVEAAIASLDADVWVVDNNSKDGSVEYLQPLFPDVHFIRNEENVGFSRANNQAIRQSKSDYILLLNPDTIVSREAIEESVKWMDSHDDAGGIATSHYNAEGKFAWESRRGVPTPLVSFCKLSGLIKLFPNNHIIGRYYMRYLDRTKPSRIEIISGAYMFLRRSALDKVGLLDEDFFMYGEDVDLSYRILQAGYRNYYLPTPILHYKGESEHPSTIRYVNVFHQAMIIFYEKHFSKRYFLSGLLIRIAVYLKALLTLIRSMLMGIFRHLPNKKKIFNYYCLASEPNADTIKQLVVQEGNNITFIPSYDNLPEDVSFSTMLLMDASTTSYDDILHTLTDVIALHPNLRLATYTPEIGLLRP